MLRLSANVIWLFAAWSCVAWAERDPLEPDWSGTQGVWVAKIQGLPLGFATTTSELRGLAAPAELDIRLLLRVGNNPVVFHASSVVSGSDSAWQAKTTSEFLVRGGNLESRTVTWRMEESKILREGSERAGLAERVLGLAPRVSPASQTWAERGAFLFGRAANEKKGDFKVFSPLSGEIFSASDLRSQWDADGWVTSFRLPLADGVFVDLKKESKEVAKALLLEIKRAPFDPQWFTSEARFVADLTSLKANATSCDAFSEESEKDVKRKIPGIPYLLHRRIVNLRTLCSGIRGVIGRNEAEHWSQERTTKALVEEIRLQEKEARRELPQALAASPEWSVFSRDDLRSQTIRVAAYFVRRGQAEVAAQIAVEQERKVNFDLRVHSALLAERSVLSGAMKMKDSAVEIRVENQIAAGKSSSHLISASEFLEAHDPVALLRSTCEREKGRAGVDLSSGTEALVRSDLFRGVWDESARIQIVPDFLLRAFSIAECSQLTLVTSRRMEGEAKIMVERFRHDILQTENRFQVSNGKFTKFRVVPGLYELTLSSYVNGAKLGQQEFRVTDKGKDSLSLSFR